jgi:uncharacterized protein (DUF1697 family)
MTKFAIFLRGINVGGIRISMADLTICLIEAELKDIKTYLQTGNVTCTYAGNAEELKTRSEQALTEKFKYEAYVLVFTQSELEALVRDYPWTQTPPDTHRYAILCFDPQVQNELLEFGQANIKDGEKIAVGNNVIYWQVPRGITLTSNFGKFLSKAKFKSTTTNRNLNTLEKMI